MRMGNAFWLLTSGFCLSLGFLNQYALELNVFVFFFFFLYSVVVILMSYLCLCSGMEKDHFCALCFVFVFGSEEGKSGGIV